MTRKKIITNNELCASVLDRIYFIIFRSKNGDYNNPGQKRITGCNISDNKKITEKLETTSHNFKSLSIDPSLPSSELFVPYLW